MDSREVRDIINEFPILDIIFIDGGHKYDVCISDLEFASKKGKDVGVDDTGGKSPGVTKALVEFLHEHNFEKIKEWNYQAGAILFKNNSLQII